MNKAFVIQCDASDYRVGAVVYQECDGIEHPVTYGGKVSPKLRKMLGIDLWYSEI